MKTAIIEDGNDRDKSVDDEIESHLSSESPKSFFLFAGAGSGKTGSLVEALKRVSKNRGASLTIRGQRVCVITYTKKAAEEITHRLQYDPLVDVSTIHSFIWRLIKGFNSDIKFWLEEDLKKDLLELNSKKSREGTKAEIDRVKSIEAKSKRLTNLPNIKTFTYNPNGENRSKESLNHTEVISLGAFFLSTKPLMQKILISQYPILLIDESQDTNKDLLTALFLVQAAHANSFALGLLGDMMQRIYSDGVKDLGENLPPDWATPNKKMNHRCPVRVVKLINNIRSSVDQQIQMPRSDKPEGFVRLFISKSKFDNKVEIEQSVLTRMQEITSDKKWVEDKNAVKILILEHHMAAKRAGFSEMFKPLYKNKKLKMGLLDGSLTGLRFFIDLILPIYEAKSNDDFKIAAVVRKYSPLISKQTLQSLGNDQAKQVTKAHQAVISLRKVIEKEEATFMEALIEVASSGLFDIPEVFKPIVFRTKTESENILVELSNNTKEGDSFSLENESDEDEDEVEDALNSWDEFLRTSFHQILDYSVYVTGKARFDTHQGVKGLEFPRVLVIMDDDEAGGFLFSYEKLFGTIEKTKTDTDNEKDGKDTSIDRTKRLLYVTCSRALESLALVAYSKDPEAVAKHVIKEGWFSKDEIEILV